MRWLQKPKKQHDARNGSYVHSAPNIRTSLLMK